MVAVGHYNFLTSYLIHGGTDYEDNYGIDLSSNITTFCNNLTTLVNDTYKDKLYKVYGKVPIKLNVKYSRDWHDPLDKMEIALFNTKAYRPSHSAFGYMRKKGGTKHTGLDLFALDGTPVYACMDGVIHYDYTDTKKIMVMDIEYF